MTGLDFFVDLAVTGTVLGLDDTSDVTTVRDVFGCGYEPGDELEAYSYGLVEFGWYCHRGSCEVTYFGAQPHRLPWLTRDREVEPELVERYGEFPGRLDVDELRAAVARRGFPLVEVPYHDDDYVDYWSPVSRMGVLAERSGRSVVKLLGRTCHGPWLSFPGGHRTFQDHVRHLLRLGAAEREAWFDRHEPPADREDRADWWRCLRMCAGPVAGTEAGAARERRRLALALVRAAAAREALPADEAAASEVTVLVAAARDDDPLAPLDGPVRRWLAAVPVPRAEATRQDIAVARLLRDRIHEVGRALPHLTDPAVAAEVRSWREVGPLLLAGPARGPGVSGTLRP
jgi:hypothetical protein